MDAGSKQTGIEDRFVPTSNKSGLNLNSTKNLMFQKAPSPRFFTSSLGAPQSAKLRAAFGPIQCKQPYQSTVESNYPTPITVQGYYHVTETGLKEANAV